MQGDEQVASPARARARAAAPRARKRSSSATSVSIIVLPTNCIRSSAMPSARRFSTASSECRKSSSERWSVTTRLISSGIERSKLRRPDSTWPTGIPSRAAHSAAARVELTSPGTSTRSGRSSPSTGSSRSITRAVCSAWRARSRRRACGRARAPRAPRRRRRTSPGRSAARCGRSRGAHPVALAAAAAITGAILTKLGRVPTT